MRESASFRAGLYGLLGAGLILPFARSGDISAKLCTALRQKAQLEAVYVVGHSRKGGDDKRHPQKKKVKRERPDQNTPPIWVMKGTAHGKVQHHEYSQSRERRIYSWLLHGMSRISTIPFITDFAVRNAFTISTLLSAKQRGWTVVATWSCPSGGSRDKPLPRYLQP
jgi:hypothetical protein